LCARPAACQGNGNAFIEIKISDIAWIVQKENLEAAPEPVVFYLEDNLLDRDVQRGETRE
jgi:hypothetical protein